MKNMPATLRRKIRISRGIRGTEERPRVTIVRSNTSIHAQIVNDATGKTICGVNDKHLNGKTGTKTEKAKALGLVLAEIAKKANITKIVFDKGEYRYHGRVKAFADGIREGGLQF